MAEDNKKELKMDELENVTGGFTINTDDGQLISFPDIPGKYIIKGEVIPPSQEWRWYNDYAKGLNSVSVQLYLNQKQTLEAFLERGAISKAQFDKSLGDLTVKMGMSLTGE